MNRWHSETVAQLLQELDARPGGLSPHQAEERLRRYGPNELEPPRQEGLLGRILGQLKDPMILVLLGAAGVSLAASGGEDWLDAVIILVIVVVNGIISISQEDRAQQALEELRKLSSPQAAVLRGGKVTKIPAAQLVPGDVILLEAGDLVPADARILECSRLQADESPMTGESVPVEKAPSESLPADAPLGDWTNMVISGTLITAGRGTALVCATGMDTQMGHIAGLLLDSEGTDTPLQRRMGEISKTLSFLCLCVCAVMFGVGLIQGKDLLDMFLTAVSLAVAAIPEGLPAIVTIVLALGVGRMARRGAIVKKLPAVETLGCAGVICSDKTGTLTQNRMTVQQVWIPAGGRRREALLAGCLCSDARLEWRAGAPAAQGDPTEGALVASISRGMSVINSGGGARTMVCADAMTRAPVLRVEGIEHSKRVIDWIDSNKAAIDEAVAETTSHGRLVRIDKYPDGRSLYLRFAFETGDAMGMNMATIASESVCRLIEKETGAVMVSVSGNMCSDKKPAAINMINGRGKTVVAEALIPKDVVEQRLHTTSAAVQETNYRKNLMGSSLAGTLGANAHAANMVAALYIATGQDPAQVVGGSMSVTSCEDVGGDLYISVRMPTVEVGTVGGGTRLPCQREALSMIGCLGEGKARKLAEIVAVTVLAGELSTLAAQAAGQLGSAHAALGR